MKRLILCCLIASLSSIYAFGQQDTLQQYTGKYKFPEGSVIPEVEVVLNDGVLVMNSSVGTSALRHEKDDEFTIIGLNGSAVFKRGNDKDKKVNTVLIDAMGYTVSGNKETSGIRAPGIIRVILPVGSFLKPSA